MSLGLTILVLSVLCAVLFGVAAERTSRANAWQRIAEERRWNTERHPHHREG